MAYRKPSKRLPRHSSTYPGAPCHISSLVCRRERSLSGEIRPSYSGECCVGLAYPLDVVELSTTRISEGRSLRRGRTVIPPSDYFKPPSTLFLSSSSLAKDNGLDSPSQSERATVSPSTSASCSLTAATPLWDSSSCFTPSPSASSLGDFNTDSNLSASASVDVSYPERKKRKRDDRDHGSRSSSAPVRDALTEAPLPPRLGDSQDTAQSRELGLQIAHTNLAEETLKSRGAEVEGFKTQWVEREAAFARYTHDVDIYVSESAHKHTQLKQEIDTLAETIVGRETSCSARTSRLLITIGVSRSKSLSQSNPRARSTR